jgi:hypothetical protein
MIPWVLTMLVVGLGLGRWLGPAGSGARRAE